MRLEENFLRGCALAISFACRLFLKQSEIRRRKFSNSCAVPYAGKFESALGISDGRENGNGVRIVSATDWDKIRREIGRSIWRSGRVAKNPGVPRERKKHCLEWKCHFRSGCVLLPIGFRICQCRVRDFLEIALPKRWLKVLCRSRNRVRREF